MLRSLDGLHASCLPGNEAQLGGGAAALIVRHHLAHTVLSHIAEVTTVVTVDGQTILCDKVVEELIAHQLDGDLRAVALGIGDKTRLGWYGHCCTPREQ